MTRLYGRKTPIHYGPEEPREDRIVSYCKLGLLVSGEAACTPLWMRGQLVSAPLETAHSCVGSAPVLSIPKQPAKRIQPEPRRQDRTGQDRADPLLHLYGLIVGLPPQPGPMT